MHTETREGSRYNCCWVKECLPITSMAGATIFSVVQTNPFTYSIDPGKTTETVGSVMSESVTEKGLLDINGSHMFNFNYKKRYHSLHAVIQGTNQFRRPLGNIMQQFRVIPFQFHMFIGDIQGS